MAEEGEVPPPEAKTEEDPPKTVGEAPASPDASGEPGATADGAEGDAPVADGSPADEPGEGKEGGDGEDGGPGPGEDGDTGGGGDAGGDDADPVAGADGAAGEVDGPAEASGDATESAGEAVHGAGGAGGDDDAGNAEADAAQKDLNALADEVGCDAADLEGSIPWKALFGDPRKRLDVRALSDAGLLVEDRARDLVEANADLDQACPASGLTPLSEAVLLHATTAVDLLLRHKASPDLPANGRPPLNLAAWAGSKYAVESLLSVDADVDAKDHHGSTPLLASAIAGSTEIALALINDGEADVDLANEHGTAPIHVAAAHGNAALLECLLEKKANTLLPDNKGDTALHHALRTGGERAVLALLDAVGEGPELEAPNDTGETPLHIGAAMGMLSVVDAILSRGIYPDMADEAGRTPLFYAVVGGHFPVATALLAAGARAEYMDERDCTPAFFAALHGHKDLAEMLCKHSYPHAGDSSSPVKPFHTVFLSGVPLPYPGLRSKSTYKEYRASLSPAEQVLKLVPPPPSPTTHSVRGHVLSVGDLVAVARPSGAPTARGGSLLALMRCSHPACVGCKARPVPGQASPVPGVALRPHEVMGVVRYIGRAPHLPPLPPHVPLPGVRPIRARQGKDYWVGVELLPTDEPEGVHDGSIEGVRYFSSDYKCGILVAPWNLRKLSRAPAEEVKCLRLPLRGASLRLVPREGSSVRDVQVLAYLPNERFALRFKLAFASDAFAVQWFVRMSSMASMASPLSLAIPQNEGVRVIEEYTMPVEKEEALVEVSDDDDDHTLEISMKLDYSVELPPEADPTVPGTLDYDPDSTVSATASLSSQHAPSVGASGTTDVEALLSEKVKLKTYEYEVLEDFVELVTGGFGKVSKAVLHGAAVAVKEPLSPYHELSVRALCAEANVLAALDHAHVLAFVGATVESVFTVITEYVSHGSLHRLLHSAAMIETTLSFFQKAVLIEGVAKGLSYLHTLKFVHGDVKPMNVLVGEDFAAKLCDFGNTAQEFSGKHTALGTKRYMSPETLSRGKIDHLSDVYSFTILCYEVLTRQRPFYPGERTNYMLPPGRVRDEWSPPVCEMLQRGWSPTPSDRPDMGHWAAVASAVASHCRTNAALHTASRRSAGGKAGGAAAAAGEGGGGTKEAVREKQKEVQELLEEESDDGSDEVF